MIAGIIMPTIYLVRHAHAEWSQDDNRPLSVPGLLDAERVAAILGELPIAGIFSSPSLRARQTVMPLAACAALPIHEISDLREREIGQWTAGDFDDAVRMTFEDPSFAHPGEETNLSTQERGVAAIRRVITEHPHGKLILATHGTLLRLILQHFDQTVDFSYWQSLTAPDIHRLEIFSDGGASIARIWEPAIL